MLGVRGALPRGHWTAAVKAHDAWRSLGGVGSPMYERGLAEWGSITKAVTAAATEAAIEDGLLGGGDIVHDIVPELSKSSSTIRSLIEHTGGLPRNHSGMKNGIWTDPYEPLIGTTLSEDALASPGIGAFNYSNLGYALLGRVLDRVTEDWWLWCIAKVLRPAGVTSASLSPPCASRLLRPRLRGGVDDAWPIGKTPYAAAGGIWSTFSDLQRFADWSLEASSRRTGWREDGDAVWVNGQTKHSGACILMSASTGLAAVVHTIGKKPYASDAIALRLLRDASREQ